MIDLDNQVVQVVAVAGVVALGCVSLFVSSEQSTTISIAVATALGALVGYLFPRGGNTDERKEVP